MSPRRRTEAAVGRFASPPRWRRRRRRRRRRGRWRRAGDGAICAPDGGYRAPCLRRSVLSQPRRCARSKGRASGTIARMRLRASCSPDLGEDAACRVLQPAAVGLPRPPRGGYPSAGRRRGGRSADVGLNPFRLARKVGGGAARRRRRRRAARLGSYPRLGAFEVGYALLLGGRLAGHGMVGSKLVSGLFPNTSRMGTELIRCVQDDLARDHSRREAEAATALRRMQSERQEAEEAAVKAAEAAAEVHPEGGGKSGGGGGDGGWRRERGSRGSTRRRAKVPRGGGGGS